MKTNLKETPVGPWASVRVCDGGEEPRGWFERAETLPVQCNHRHHHQHHHHYLIVVIIIIIIIIIMDLSGTGGGIINTGLMSAFFCKLFTAGLQQWFGNNLVTSIER